MGCGMKASRFSTKKRKHEDDDEDPAPKKPKLERLGISTFDQPAATGYMNWHYQNNNLSYSDDSNDNHQFNPYLEDRGQGPSGLSRNEAIIKLSLIHI